jgi:Xaa-Pro aminopeptidase
VSAPTTRYGFLADALAARDCDAALHVAGVRDPTMRYLARVDRPGSFAFVYADGEAALCAPRDAVAGARRAFPGETVYGPEAFAADAATPGERAVAVLDAAEATGDVLAPDHLPRGAARTVARSGRAIATTDAVADARESKSGAELEAVRRTGRAAGAAMARIEDLLAGATAAADGRLRAAGGPGAEAGDWTLSTGVLRREANAALAAEGAAGAGHTVVAAGAAGTDPTFGGDVPLRADAPVAVSLTPRGPAGYHAHLARTFTPASAGGWDRRAFLGVESALSFAMGEVVATEPAAGVRREAVAELGSHGFHDPLGTVGRGIGLGARERPALDGDRPLRAGQVLALSPGVADPEEGAVRLGETLLVTEGGYDLLTEYPRSLTPEPRARESDAVAADAGADCDADADTDEAHGDCGDHTDCAGHEGRD